MQLLESDQDRQLEAQTQMAKGANRWWRNLRTYLAAKAAGKLGDCHVAEMKVDALVPAADDVARALGEVEDIPDEGDADSSPAGVAAPVDTESPLSVCTFSLSHTHSHTHTHTHTHKHTHTHTHVGTHAGGRSRRRRTGGRSAGRPRHVVVSSSVVLWTLSWRAQGVSIVEASPQ